MRSSLLVACLVASCAFALVAGMPSDSDITSSSIFDRSADVNAKSVGDVAPATTKIFVHQSGINLIQNVVNAILEQDLKNVALPDDTIKIAAGHADLTGITIKNIVFQAQQVGLVAPNSFTIDLNNFSGELDFNWKYKGPLGVHDHGSATTTFGSTSIANVFTCNSDASGRPVVTLTSLNVKIDDLNIHFSGGGAWLINLLIKLVKPMMIKKLQTTIASVATTDFNKILSTITAKYPLFLPLTGDLLNTTKIDLSLVPSSGVSSGEGDAATSAFSIAGSYLVVGGEFAFESTTNSTIDPRQHDWIPDSLPTNPAGTPPMFGISIDEYFSGSLLYTLTQNGKFNYYIDQSHLPPSSLIRLNTHLLASEYPELYDQFPNTNISFTIEQWMDQPPLATTAPSGTSWSNAIGLTINLLDIAPSQPITPVCTLMINFTLDTSFEFISNSTGIAAGVEYFTGTFSPLVFDVSVAWARIDPGSFGTEVEGFVTTVMNDVLVPILNSILSKGLPVPLSSGGMGLKNLFVSYGNHVVSLGFDLALAADEDYMTLAEKMFDWERK